LTEHDDVIESLVRGAPRLGLALGSASARADPGRTSTAVICETVKILTATDLNLSLPDSE